MGRIPLWWWRASWTRWFFVLPIIAFIWAIIQEWVFSDITEYIRSFLGVDMNIVDLIIQKPITIVAILAVIAVAIWILRTGSKVSALQDLYKSLLDVREASRLAVTNALPKMIIQHNKEMHQDAYLLALQTISTKGKGKKGNITPEELTDIRVQRLIPDNAELEEFLNKDKKLNKLWKRIRLLQTAIMDDDLDKEIAWLQRMIKLNNAYKVYKEVMTRCYIIKLEEYSILPQTVKLTEDALDKAHKKVNQRLAVLAHNKELSKAKRVAGEEVK